MKHVNRKGTYSVKTDALKKYFGKDNLIPLWVADMDFETPQCVREALEEVLKGGVYGYNFIPDNYFPTIVQWLKEKQKWEVDQQWLTFIPGIVKGIGYAINFFTEEGDGIIVQPPVYPPFINVPKGNDRKLVFNPLIRVEDENGGTYRMDFENLRKIGESGECSMLILSNPHNPGGIAWDYDTLKELAEICHKYEILVVSDEIHADMPLFGTEHIPFASVSKEAARNSITFGAPSKTFNMAGIVSSFAVVPNEELREPFYRWMRVNELSSPTIFATLGAIAAYTEGDDWRMKMLDYIEGNIVYVENFCKDNLSGLVKPVRPLSSFLIWLDCRELCNKLFGCIDQQRLVHLFVVKAGLALNDGGTFGPGGEGYMRLNVGCGLGMLEEAMAQLKKAVDEY